VQLRVLGAGAILFLVGVEELASAWRERLAREGAEVEARAARARERARVFARRLVEEYGAREVWLFGSLAWGRPHRDFDVDLAVKGLAHERYFRALSDAWEAVGAPVDLVPLEACAPGLRERILKEGERLDGR
jgi:predicted nucleotidyltransferase